MHSSPAVFPDSSTWASPRPPALPLPAIGWGAQHALLAWAEAQASLPVATRAGAAGEAVVVSALTTVVLRAGEYAIKVYPDGTDAEHLQSCATELAGSTTAHLPAADPIATSQGVVTLTPWLPSSAPVSWPAVGDVLRRFHAEHAAAAVPTWAPLSRLPGQVHGLPAHAAQLLLRARARLLDALDDVHSPLGRGVIHGDVSPSNVMHTPTGPRLIDLDWVAVAPLEYDLASAARRFRDGSMSAEGYTGFCDSYGYDVTGWGGLPLLDRIADLGGVAFRLWDDRQHGRCLDWVEAELEVWAHLDV